MVLGVRPIANEEGNHLRTSIRHADDPIEMKRAQVVLGSAQGFTVQKIGIFSGMTDGYIRTLIHQFNADGISMLKPRWNPGNRHKFSKETRGRLVALATSRPRDLGLLFGRWSLRRLRDTAVARGIVESISLEWLRVIGDEADITHQSIRTWKESSDPQFAERRRRIDRLTAKRHNPPVVLSVDEVGPISLRPHGGEGVVPKGSPGPHSRGLHPRAGHSIRVRLPQRLPSDPQPPTGGAQGVEDLAAVAEVPAIEVSPGAEGLHHPGRAERALDPRDPSVGEVEQEHARPLGDERLVDEPGGVPRGAPPDGRDGRERLSALVGGRGGVQAGRGPHEPGEPGLRQGVPKHPTPGQQTPATALDAPLGKFVHRCCWQAARRNLDGILVPKDEEPRAGCLVDTIGRTVQSDQGHRSPARHYEHL